MIIRIPEITDISVVTDSYQFTINRYYIVTIDTTDNNAITYIGLTSDTLPRDPATAVPDITFVVGPKHLDLASQVNWTLQEISSKQETDPEI